MKIPEVRKLIDQYGKRTTLEMIYNGLTNKLQYICPKCKGVGSVEQKYNAYPSGLPDSGWVDDWKYRTIECTLCGGQGRTETKKVPRVVQDEWVDAK